MCIHSYDSSAEDTTLDAGLAWTVDVQMPLGRSERFSCGVVQRDDGRVVVSLLNHTHADVGVVQWLGAEGLDEASAQAYVAAVLKHYGQPKTFEDRLLELRYEGRPGFFIRADAEVPGFEPLEADDVQPKPEGFAGA